MRKMMTVATTCLTLFCTIPQHGICFDPTGVAKELVQNALNSDTNAFLEQLAQLQQEISVSENPLAEGRAFIHALTSEINAQLGTSYTVQDFYNMIRCNLDAFQIPEEFRAEFLDTLALLESEETPQKRHHENEWNFFKKSKKPKKDVEAECSPSAVLGAISRAATILLNKPDQALPRGNHAN